ncbi:MAG TPA: helix-turn-helix domain-containing protein [Mucilaginibacter sp.]|nr:helix-turn-helix domain-containing protein [Mucilaginibacter sp.]
MNKLKEVQLQLFAQLSDEMRTKLLQLANFKPGRKRATVIVPEWVVGASAVQIIFSVCKSLGVKYAELKSPSRQWKYVEGRFLAYYLLSVNSVNDAQVAHLFNRDRTSVIYGRGVHEEIITTNSNYRTKFYAVVAELKKLTDKEAVSA